MYYDKNNGNVIYITPELEGDIVLTTIEEDLKNYKQLSDRHQDSFEVLELEFGKYTQDFNLSVGYRVNLDTKELEFTYPNPSEPESPPVFQKPLTEQIKELESKMDTAVMELTMVLAGMTLE